LKLFVVLFLTLSVFATSPVFSAPNCFSKPKESNNKIPKSEIELKLKNQQLAFEKAQAKNRAICLVTVEQLKKIPASRLLVDVRQTNQARSIPVTNINVVNIPLHMLKHKQYLKNKPLILTPIGAELRELITACGKLRQKGFKQTYVLTDGIQALQGVTKSKLLPANKMGLISPKRLFIERFERDWQIIYVGKGEHGRIGQYFKVIKTKNNPLRTINKLINQKNTTKKPTGIVVVDLNGSNHTLVKKQLKNIRQPNVYYLQGGAQLFNDFIHKQYLQTAKSEFVLQEPQRCK